MPLPRLLSSVVLVAAVVAPGSTAARVQAPRVIEIHATDNMRFAPTRIDVRPGERVTVVLKSIGTMPKTAMAHNFVLLRKGADPKAFCDKSASARDTDFIAPSVKDQVLASTKTVGPGETAEVTFTAPEKQGQYTFVCSFTGHFAMGMRGTFVVSPKDMSR